MPASASKRPREGDGGAAPPAKRPAPAGRSKQSTRRALRSALARYARIGQSALAAAQRAQVLLRRVEATSAEIGASLARQGPNSTGPTQAMVAPDVASALARAKARQLAALRDAAAPRPGDLALRLNAEGQAVDASGKVVETQNRVSSLLVHEKRNETAEPKKANPYVQFRPDTDGCDVADPRVLTKRRESKKDRAFAFVQEGHYVKIAEATRAREASQRLMTVRRPEDLDGDGAPEGADDMETDAPDAAPRLPPRSEHYASIPGMEWWDEDFLSRELRASRHASVAQRMRDDYDRARLDHNRYHGLVHHPAAARPLAGEKKEPANMPFYLTKKDQKRVRRQQRAEREREKQDKIQLGLIPAPEPKFKLSNFMKVLGEQAVADPSKLEKRVMEQVRGRLTKHEMRNRARKLTPQEKKEKARRKMAEDTSDGVTTAVFYVASLASSQHRFKIDVNAQQLGLTGGVLICSAPDMPCALVVVEGGPRAVKRYAALMTRRIDWADAAQLQATEVAENWCVKAWAGVVAKRAFSAFKFQECKSTLTARRVLDAKGVAHYWDMVAQAHAAGPPKEDVDDEED